MTENIDDIECDTIGEHLFKKNIISQRYNFYQRCQESEETLYAFLENIRYLAELCDFHVEEREFLIRDRLVCGLIDSNLKSKIIDNGGNPSIEQVFEICEKYPYEPINLKEEINVFMTQYDTENDAVAFDDKNEEEDIANELNIAEKDDINSDDITNDDDQTDSKHNTTKRTIDKAARLRNIKARRRRKLSTINKNKFKCMVCNKLFNDIRYYQGHIVTHTINNDVSNGPNPTSVGGDQLGSSSIIEPMGDQYNFQCPTCQKEFANVRLYMGHIVEHSLEGKTVKSKASGKFNCYFCQRLCRSYDDLMIHYASHHVKGNADLPKIRCRICGKHNAVGNLRTHMIRHVDSNQCILPCEHCDKKFPTYDQLTRHKKIHEERQKLVCDICSKEFSRRIYLEAHKGRIHPEEQQELQELKCIICQKQCRSVPFFKRHMYWHSLPKDHLCTQCGERFRTPDLLKRHLTRADHNGVESRKFQCDVCFKKFHDKTQYTNHKVVHTKERPYPCTYENCDKRYSTKGMLKLHIRTHTGEKPYHCKMCDYSCTSCTYLKRHMLVHTGRHN